MKLFLFAVWVGFLVVAGLESCEEQKDHDIVRAVRTVSSYTEGNIIGPDNIVIGRWIMVPSDNGVWSGDFMFIPNIGVGR